MKGLNIYHKKARILEQRIKQQLSSKQLVELAQEAAEANRSLTSLMMVKDDREMATLTDLSRQFSNIEYQVMSKFYGGAHSGPNSRIL
jgi:hypothetical protein